MPKRGLEEARVMEDQPSECLSEDVIVRLAHDMIPPGREDVLNQHLADCCACWNRYVQARPQTAALTVPGYHIGREIGRGVSSVVHEAWWLKGRRRLVALKLMWPASEEQRARFEREVTVQSRLDHPNIVKCLDSGNKGVMMYYAMDLVRGLHLDKYLDHHAHTLDEKLVVFRRVCQALADAHAEHVAHRDLKPSNILVDSTGQPHILDFGLCAAEPNEWSTLSQKTQTRPGDIIGTVKYMSPEQAWGGLLGGQIDYRTDIWAMGVMLYEIATDGDYPYELGPTLEKSSEEALLYRIRMEAPKPARIKSAEHAHSLKRLIDRCLAWEKEKRIQSAVSLGEDIARCLSHEPVRTKALSYGYRLRRITVGLAVKRRELLWMANITAVLLVLSAIAFVGNVRWRVQGYSYTQSTALMPASTEDARNNIVIVGISDKTDKPVRAFAAAHGLANVTSDIRTWRALHGEVMQRLAGATPSAVAWDFYFRSPRPEDGEFVAGVHALEAANVPVVLAVQAYKDDDSPDLSPTILGPLEDTCHFGGILARDAVKRAGEFIVAVRHGEKVRPSLALATLGALLHPERKLVVDWSSRTKQIQLAYQQRDGSGLVLPDWDTVDLSRVYRSPKNVSSVRAGDTLACRTFELDRPQKWEKRTFAYEDVLSATPERLAELVGGRIVIFGDLRGPGLFRRADRHRVKYGRDIIENVPGSYLIADAIHGLLVNSYLKPAFPLNGRTLSLMGALALLGCIAPLMLARIHIFQTRQSQGTLVGIALGLAVVSIAIMLQLHQRLWLHVAMASVAFGLAMAGALWIELARTRRSTSSVPEHASRTGPTPPTGSSRRLSLAGH